MVVFSGGEPLPATLAGEITDEAYLIAADSGLDTALSWGYDVDLVVGDLDSVSGEALAASSAPIERHSPDKDATDLDLALEAALRLDPDRIVVIGGQGGRFDHLLGTVLLLTSDRWAGVDLEWVAGGGRVRVVRAGVTLHGAPGALLTLLAVGGPATGVTTSGLHWDLADATLQPGSTRGVSNVFIGPVANVRLTAGLLLAIQPDVA
ncbi:MAG TPA: thiamine diphosphokinase [Acidimicrobiia bacterium]|nr:thiamine diphosphokinase [Acidimicrobiia bacterium]